MENKTIRVWDKMVDCCSSCEMCGLGIYGTEDKNKIHSQCKFSKPLSKENIESCGFTVVKEYSDEIAFQKRVDDYNFYSLSYQQEEGYKICIESWYQSKMIPKVLPLNTWESFNIFCGKINNLPEFKLILKMLNIE